MRSSKAFCLVLASLNVLVFAAQMAGGGDDALKARVSLSAKTSMTAEPRGASVPFRLRGELPEPTAPALSPTPAEPPAEAPIDTSAFAFLGTMTSPQGATEYFFKKNATNRVYSAGLKDSEIKLLETSEKEFLIEIDGTKYKVAR
jgi:hypothetical protein